MFHMLSSFDLDPDTTIERFGNAVVDLTLHMQQKDLVMSVSPIGRRQHHPVMDTDAERQHEYYFIMSFRDRAQCDLAVESVFRSEEPGESLHNAVKASIVEPVFTCWEDLTPVDKN